MWSLQIKLDQNINFRFKNKKAKMSYFYSQKMTYCEGIMPREIAWDVMDELGQMDCVHFENKTVQYESPYMKGLKRCEEVINNIKEIKSFIYEIKPDFKLRQDLPCADLLKEFQREIKLKNIHGHLFMNDIEDQIHNIHGYLTRQKKELDKLNRELTDCLMDAALLITLSKSEDFQSITKQKKEEINFFSEGEVMFEFKCLVINRVDQSIMEKGLFRISRGNSWVKCLEINDTEIFRMFHKTYSEILEKKCICIIMYQVSESRILLNKINRFLSCMETTSTNLLPQRWPSSLQRIQEKVKELNNLIHLTSDAVERYLHKLYEPRGNSEFSYLTFLEAYAQKEYEIYKQLSCTFVSKNFVHFNVFIPSKNLPLDIQPNQRLPPLTLTPKNSIKSPPTKFDTPPIMEIPQEILNTYGVPTYGEFNPAVFYIITFGFFIGVMFGDIGHMLMAIPFVIYTRANIWVWTVIFFMGYCGLIYNQFFGLNFGLFDSCYEFPDMVEVEDYYVGNETMNSTEEELFSNNETMNAIRIDQCVFPIGIDSIWKAAQNEMQFTNSLKMKVAVILGVVHMMLGLSIKLVNGIKRRKLLEIFTLTIPQILFMMVTFLYMDYLIILKWNIDYSGEKSRDAPSIIGTMIEVFAGFSAGDTPVFWKRQRNFQKFLVAIMALMIPIMLLGIPLGTYIKRRGQSERTIIMNKNENDDMNEMVEEDPIEIETDPEMMRSEEVLTNIKKEVSGTHHIAEKEPIKEILVHQFIETIEYVLGTVSNTASYLRLWALSLAHGQLSEVIFDLVLKSSVIGGYKTIIGALLVFPFFYAITFGVLICMDIMQCFLHSLRLHWVQFQNKFYKGTGYLFTSFNFNKIIQEQKNKQ